MLTTHPNPRLALMLVVLLGSLSGALAQERDTDVPALLENGNYYLSQGNCPLAQYFYQEALKLETENDLALVGKGRALACQGALADAVSSFEDAIDSNAENVSAYVQVALTYERQHRSDPENYPNRLGEALDVLAQAERIAPDSPQVLNTKGIILYSLGNLEDARTTLERASTLAGAGNSVLSRSEQSRVQVNLGRVYRDLDQLEQARNAFRRAVVFDPTSTSAHNNLGNIHFRLGNCADAEYELAQASTLSPNSLSAVVATGHRHVRVRQCGCFAPAFRTGRGTRGRGAHAPALHLPGPGLSAGRPHRRRRPARPAGRPAAARERRGALPSGSGLPVSGRVRRCGRRQAGIPAGAGTESRFL